MRRCKPTTHAHFSVSLPFVIHSLLLSPAFSCHVLSPFCHPERTWIPASLPSPATTDVVLSKENHMQLTEVTTLDRNPGKPRDLRCAIRVPRTYRPTTSTKSTEPQEIPTSPLSSRFENTLSSSNRPFLTTALSFLSSRAYLDFLLRYPDPRPRMWFSLKRTTCS